MPSLYNPDDPWASLNEQSRQRQAPAQPASLPPLTPEEQDSLLPKVGSSALHGLGYLGSVLSKTFGGRAIRGGLGMLSGRDVPASELLSMVPFSDMTGLTNPENEVHGSYLLGGNKDTSFFSPEGIGGLGIDIATDPLTYLTVGGGATTHLGKAAAKLGTLPGKVSQRLAGFAAASPEASSLAQAMSKSTGKLVTAADVAGQRLGGHWGLSLPFGEAFGSHGLTFDATNQLAALGKVGAAAKAAPIIGKPLTWAGDVADAGWRAGRALFDGPIRSVMDSHIQQLAPEAGEQAAAWAYRESAKVAEFDKAILAKAGWKWGDPLTPAIKAEAERIGKLVTAAGERIPAGGDWTTFATNYPAEAANAKLWLSKADPEVISIAEKVRGWYDAFHAEAKAAGFGDVPLQDSIQYMRRQSSLDASAGLHARPQGVTPTGQIGRQHEVFGGLYQDEINSILADQSLRQKPLAQAAGDIAARIGWDAISQAELAALQAKQTIGTTLSKAEQLRMDKLAQLPAQAEKLARLQRSLPDAAIQKMGGFFANSPVAELEGAVAKYGTRITNADMTYKFLAQTGTDLGGAGVPISRVLEESKLTSPHAMLKMSEALAAAKGITPGQAQGMILQGLEISKDQASALLKSVGQGAAPEAAGPFLRALDSVQNLWKAGSTTFPQTVARNFLSDAMARMFHGGETGIPGAIARLFGVEGIGPISKGMSLVEGKTIPGIAAKIGFAGSDAEATQHILTEAYRTGLSSGKKFQTLDASGLEPGVNLLKREQPFIGTPKTPLMELIAKDMPWNEGSIKPWLVRGVNAQQESKFFPVATTQHASQRFEDIQRLGTMTGAMERGFESIPAYQQAIKAHHDFGALSNFEKNTMRRIVPFYCVPETAEILTRKGWKTYEHLEVGEDVLTYSIEIDNLQWQPCLGKAIFDHDQEIMKFTHGKMLFEDSDPWGVNYPKESFLFTPNHRWPVRVRKVPTASVDVVAGSDLNDSHSFLISADCDFDDQGDELLDWNRHWLIWKRRGLRVNAGRLSTIHYKGRVWCPQTANGTWVMRQGRLPVITGNSWMRQNAPVMVREIIENPGGRMAQTMRAVNEMGGHNQGALPEGVSSTGYAIPVGETEPGRQRYLTALGLPFEDIANLMSGRQLMGSTSPYLRLPFELATGTQTYTGRDAPSDFPIAGHQMADQIIANSPLSRLVSTARNFATKPLVENLVAQVGPRTTTVNVDAARRQAIQQYVEETLATNPAAKQYERLYVPSAQLPLLSPQERQLLRLYQTARQVPANQLAR